MLLDRLWRCCRVSGFGSLALVAAACGGGSGTASSPVPVVNALPSPTPTPVPSATSTPVPTPAPSDTTTGVIVQSGDSIGAGFGADNWAAIDHLGFASSVAIHNVSVVGIAMQAGFGQRATDLFPFVNSRVPSVLVIQQGTNDLYYGTLGATLYQKILAPFVSSAQAAGFYVVVETVLPRADGGWTPNMEQQRIFYNSLVRSNAAHADVVNDVAADPLMGDGANPATSPYYTDAAHPTLAGQQRLATLDAAILTPFLQRPPRKTH